MLRLLYNVNPPRGRWDRRTTQVWRDVIPVIWKTPPNPEPLSLDHHAYHFRPIFDPHKLCNQASDRVDVVWFVYSSKLLVFFLGYITLSPLIETDRSL